MVAVERAPDGAIKMFKEEEINEAKYENFENISKSRNFEKRLSLQSTAHSGHNLEFR
jgi:hypothetical protein